MSNRKLILEVVVDPRKAEKGFAATEKAGKGFEREMLGFVGSVKLGFGTLAKSVLIVDLVQKAVQSLNESLHLGVEEFQDHSRVSAQTAAAIKSTGAVANVTAAQIDALGLSLSNLSGVDDEVIQGGENVLLAFQNIRNFAGKGNDIFTEATKASLDFAVRSGRSVQAASVAVGRALQDPAKAAGSLRRAYVVLTASEKSAIATAVRHKDILGAQRLIISDLEKRYGGAAAAAGKTLGGALNVLRERFKDLAGQGIGLVAPSLRAASVRLAEFVRHLTEASSGKAKLRIAFTGLESLGKDLKDAIVRQVERVNFREVGTRIGERLRAINWRTEIASVARQIGEAISSNLQQLNQAIRNVNWNRVGQEIAKGFGLALAAAAVFIHGLNIGKITKGIADVLGAALIAVARILEGIGQEIGKAILKGIQAGLEAAERPIVKKADEIALKIIEPFTHLPFGIGGPAQQAKNTLQKSLDDMAKVATQGAKNVSVALAPISKPIGSRNASAAFAGLPTAPTPVASIKTGLTAEQRNRFFDNAISRILLRGGIGSLQQQLAAIRRASGLITQRLAATKDITRKLNLEDQLLQLAAQARALRTQITEAATQKAQDAAQKFLDSLQFGVTKAQASTSFKDDLSALQALQDGIRREIAIQGKTLELEQQLFDTNQQIIQTRAASRNANQFKALGLTSTGDQRAPSAAHLRAQLGSLASAISGTFLDTKKTQSVFENIRRVLKGGLGAVGRDVRNAIKGILDDLDNQLKKHPVARRHVSSLAILSGLGLTPDQVRALRLRIAQIGPNGTVPGGRSIAFSGAGGTTVVQSDIYLDGQRIAQNTTRHQQKAGSRRSSTRSGPHAGRR